ncbi:MAG: (2Fe-2S)-binding protein [Bdellovibrionales bacterium]|nr:(2Fe-2S)-binding protein [Bdellovibrionales bacterium]
MAICFQTPQGKVEVECYRGLNLLGHAQLAEAEIGSRCGGHGICGGDRVRVDASKRVHFSPPTGDERKHLSPAEINDGWRLACQCYPAVDGLSLDVEAPVGPPRNPDYQD